MAKGRRSDYIPRGTQPAAGTGLQPGMLEKIKKMQEEMAATQAALETELINVTAAGGAVTIVITGHQRVQSIKLDPALIDPNDIAMLEDTLVAAINEAIVASQAHSARRLEAVTGGIELPGLF
ncbi:MAG: nucleoid-associated protein, YbaB/EbfC family [Candidatus Roseilinea sp.]|nr:MAG: nucleoid-associated protein, YbaB/EbfC family [Candidatus Roseilinea sp.]